MSTDRTVAKDDTTTDSRRRLRSRRREVATVVADYLLALLLFLYTLPLLRDAIPEWLAIGYAVALSAILCASYPVSKKRPLAAFSVVLVVFIAELLMDIGFLPSAAVALLVLYRVAVICERRHSLAAAAICVVVLIVAAGRWENPYFGVPETVSAVILIVSVWVWGATIGTRRAYVSAVEQRAAQLEREQRNLHRIAVATERARIARELHDVVSHSLSVVVVMAAGAAAQVRTNPAAAEQAILAVERTGRTSLSEMRRMLDVLRDDEAESMGPQPGLAQIGQLVDDARAAGLPVELRVPDEAPQLEAGVDLTVYRIVQEALTNVRRHGGPAVTRVNTDIWVDRHDLCVRIVDDGQGEDADTLNGLSGHGLIGMRERVSTCRGELTVKSGENSGFEVLARIPIQETR